MSLHALCSGEAGYPRYTPSERMGLDPMSRIGLAFDATILSRAMALRAKAFEERSGTAAGSSNVPDEAIMMRLDRLKRFAETAGPELKERAERVYAAALEKYGKKAGV